MSLERQSSGVSFRQTQRHQTHTYNPTLANNKLNKNMSNNLHMNVEDTVVINLRTTQETGLVKSMLKLLLKNDSVILDFLKFPAFVNFLSSDVNSIEMRHNMN